MITEWDKKEKDFNPDEHLLRASMCTLVGGLKRNSMRILINLSPGIFNEQML